MEQISKIFLFLTFLMSFFLSEAQSPRKVAFETTRLKGQVKKAYPFQNLKCWQRNESANAKLNSITIFENLYVTDNLSDGVQGGGITYKTDNTVACSSIDTVNYVVAIRNSRILLYRLTPNTVASATDSLEGFMATPLPPSWFFKSVLDPRVIYDAVSERYIMTFLALKRGIVSGNQVVNDSRLQIYVSTTNNPLDPWYEYLIEDEDVTDINWYIDYPILGQSIEEVFLTANIYPKNTPNETFQDNLVLVFPKDSIYNGIKSLTNLNIVNPADTLFTMYPISSGEFGNYGPGIYLVHTDPLGYQDSLWIYNIDNDISSGNFNIFVTTIGTNNYSPTNNLNQLSSSVKIDGTDCRITGGFILGNTIHYVFNTLGASYPSQISYNRLNTANWQNTEYRYNVVGIYPSLSSFGSSTSNPSALISYQSSDSLTYPSFHVVSCDSAGDWGNDITLAAGQRENLYGFLGDYTGTYRNQSKALPTSWVYGCYMPSDSNVNYFNRLSEIVYVNTNGVTQIFEKQEFSVFPNPIENKFSLTFDKSNFSQVICNLIDNQGREVYKFYEGNVSNMPHSFIKPPIASGTYFLKLIDNQKRTIAYEKVIIN